ncbi:hypothetical protein JW930_01525 [Candidatus Woesearchaeota archaeon]|nr:hypothetical protein [Candidatus Woesearchaeota archaeon]
MADARRVLVIFVIAVLFTIFVNVTIEALYPRPDYEDYCGRDMPKIIPMGEEKNCSKIFPSQELIDNCSEGNIAYHYDSAGCPVDAYCETCYLRYETEQEKYNFVVFIISSISGLVALFVGLNLHTKNPLNEWVGSGFLLGGIITIFVGTARYFGDMGRYAKPVIILAELVLVIYLTYKKLGKR